MLKYLKRFYYRYSYPVNVLGCTGIFLFIFYKPLYFMYFTTQTEEYLKGILEFVLVKSLEKSKTYLNNQFVKSGLDFFYKTKKEKKVMMDYIGLPK